ncbi:MAG TPA: M28 family peptidase [Acidobacteriota bacterium]|nr:M28 family peptidase [Acidobacteriota bacterium]
MTIVTYLRRLIWERQMLMNKRLSLLFVLLLSASSLLPAQEVPERKLSPQKLEADVRYLASDELRGRFSTEPGGRLAADYIEKRLRESGARPLAALGGYRQSVPLQTLPASPEQGSVKLSDQEFAAGKDLLVMGGGQLRGEFPVAAGRRMEDLPQDLKGRVVLVAFGDPERPGSPRAAIRAGSAKARRAHERGAAALIEVYSGGGFENFVRFLGRSRVSSGPLDPESSATPHLLLAAGPELWNRLEQAEDLEAVLDTPARLARPASSDNVVAWVEGNDPELGKELVGLSAHYDHVGADPASRGATPEDFIFNGARDNAMGVTALMAAADALAAQPPKRSVLLIAFTGEELGLLGSAYMAEHPPFDLNHLVFLLNSDSGGYTDTDVATVVGLERVTVRPLIEQACREFGLEAIPNPAPEQRLFTRSDNIHFARLGIPAPTFSLGFRAWTRELLEHYHRPSDEVTEDFDFDYLLRFSQAFTHTIRAIADSPDQPRWVEGQPYIEAWKELYGSRTQTGQE